MFKRSSLLDIKGLKGNLLPPPKDRLYESRHRSWLRVNTKNKLSTTK